MIFFVDNTLHAADNDVWYTVDNNIASYITATGTYYLRLWDNTERGNPVDNYISVRWDDSSLTIVTKTKTFTSMMVFAYLIPLFFIIGIVLAVIYYATRKS